MKKWLIIAVIFLSSQPVRSHDLAAFRLAASASLVSVVANTLTDSVVPVTEFVANTSSLFAGVYYSLLVKRYYGQEAFKLAIASIMTALGASTLSSYTKVPVLNSFVAFTGLRAKSTADLAGLVAVLSYCLSGPDNGRAAAVVAAWSLGVALASVITFDVLSHGVPGAAVPDVIKKAVQSAGRYSVDTACLAGLAAVYKYCATALF